MDRLDDAYEHSRIKENVRNYINTKWDDISTELSSEKKSDRVSPKLWRKSYMWVKSIALLFIVYGGVIFIVSAPQILSGSLRVGYQALVMTVGAATISHIIALGERELGMWRLELLDRTGIWPKFQWRFISWD